MRKLAVRIDEAKIREIKVAASKLKSGGLIAFPTETVYGLGADAENSQALGKIFDIKGRPKDHPLIVHISEALDMKKWASDIPDYCFKLAEKFWPGPLTLILKKSEICNDLVTGKQETVGLRVPSHEIALFLLREFKKLGGMGIAAPSANIYGKTSATTSEAVKDQLGDKLNTEFDSILTGDGCEIGIESTILDCTSSVPKILRPGAVTEEMIEDLLKIRIDTSLSKKKVSGNLESHYAPKAKVHLENKNIEGAGFIALDGIETPKNNIRLASPVDNQEFAKMLYEAFRLADLKGLSNIVVLPPEGKGFAIAIRDRLNKSAARDGYKNENS